MFRKNRTLSFDAKVSAVEKSTVTSRLKGKNAESYQPEESSRFRGKKRTADESTEYQTYSKPQLSSKPLVRPRKPNYPSSPLHGLKYKNPPRRMTKSGPVDSPSNPFAPTLESEKVGESSSPKYLLRPTNFTPLSEEPDLDFEPKSDSGKMSSESRTKGMPNRRDNKAPSYDRSRPEELLRYIEDVEKELLRAGVVVDQEKKDWLRHYADQRSADEWTVLETYPSDGGSFTDFKEELVSHYPEATDSLEGSIARLDKLCAKSRPLTIDNLSIVLEFIRGFKFEGRKLLRGKCISNREIVQKFLNCLDADLKKTVVWQVSQRSLNGVTTSDEGGRRTRHHTDPIEFEELLKVSENLVRSVDSYNTITTGSTTGTASRSSGNRAQHTILQRPMENATSPGTSDRMVQLLEDLNETMAKNTDVLVNMSKENGHRHGETTKSFETMHALMNTWQKNDKDRPCNQSYPIASNQNQAPTRRDGCFYCWAVGHFIANCEFLATDVAEGKVELHDNSSRVDLKKLPKDPSYLSPKDRVDRRWQNRKQFLLDDVSEDSIVDIAPAQRNLLSLQSNRNVRDKRDEIISELQEKARRATEERDMWKAVTGTRQPNVSVPTVSQMSQSVPQLPVQSPQMTMDPKSTELMSMLAAMMSQLSTNQGNTEKGFQSAQ